MAIRYVSAHHSDDDPGGLIHEALGAGPAFRGPAEDLLLSWTLRLDAGRDPAHAAQRLLAARGLEAGPLPEGAGGRLVALLRQVAETGRSPVAGPPKRRGGRRGVGRRRPDSTD